MLEERSEEKKAKKKKTEYNFSEGFWSWSFPFFIARLRSDMVFLF